MKPPEGMTVTLEPNTHACPPKGSGVMPCCGRSPFEATSHRMTLYPELVTCGRGVVGATVTIDPTRYVAGAAGPDEGDPTDG